MPLVTRDNSINRRQLCMAKASVTRPFRPYSQRKRENASTLTFSAPSKEELTKSVNNRIKNGELDMNL